MSHETIYRTLFIQARGALKKELVAHLRRTRVMRRSRHHTQKTDNHGAGILAVERRGHTYEVVLTAMRQSEWNKYAVACAALAAFVQAAALRIPDPT